MPDTIEGRTTWAHKPRRKPRMTRWQYAITGGVIGSLVWPAAWGSAALIQWLGGML